jgi:tRNA (cytidine/uridine-2'-O-)-methyltransferase
MTFPLVYAPSRLVDDAGRFQEKNGRRRFHGFLRLAESSRFIFVNIGSTDTSKSNTLGRPKPERWMLMTDTPLALLHIALVKPEIHPNTGNIARLCAANSLPLHLVGNLGFRIDERSVRRAGLDYWPYVDLRREADIEELKAGLPGARFFYFSAHAERLYTSVRYRRGDCLVFGPESTGFSAELLRENREFALRIPMRSGKVRSLNLAVSAAVAAYEALRQMAAFV